MTSTLAFIFVCTLGFFVLSVDSQNDPSGFCCCGQGYLLVPPFSVVEECLFQHDYFTSQWTDRYNGYASAIDSCGPLNLFDGSLDPYCGCSYCPDDDNDHVNNLDAYRIASSLTSYNPICGNSILITKGFTRPCAQAFDALVTQLIRIEDTIRPELFVPPTRSVECVSLDGIAGPDFDINNLDSYFGSARATDLCTNPTLTETQSGVVANSCNYQITRDFVANDYCLTSTGTQSVSFVDTTPPTLYTSNVGSVITYTCDNTASISSTNALNIPTAIDSCDNLPNTITPLPQDIIYPGRCTGEYTIERTWSLADACSNFGYYVQTIVVEDPDPPTVSPPAVNHYTTSICTIPPPTTYTATDICGGNTYLTYEETITGVNQFEIENHFDVIRTYKASDDCGNYVSWQDIVNVNLKDLTITTAAPKTVSGQRGVPISIAMGIVADTCWDTYVFFDVGADITPTITGLTGCTSGTGGATVCILPAGTYNPLAVTVSITVPTSYLPDTLEIRQSTAVQNPYDGHYQSNIASRTIITLTS